MAKKAILDVLESSIGRFVEGLDTDRLNIGVWSGQVELHSLQLNVSGINEELAVRSVPIRVVEGHLDCLKLQVPWARLTSRSVVLKLQGLHLVVEPRPAESSSSSKEDDLQGPEKRREARTKALEAAEKGRLAWKTLTASLEGGDDSDAAASGGKSSSSSFGARLVRRIVENVQVDIENVHLSVRGGGGESATGVVLESLSLVTTDEAGKRTFVDRSKTESLFLHKLLQITGLGLYCNDLTTTTTSRNYGAAVKDNSKTTTTPAASDVNDYLLSPVSLQVKLRQSDHVGSTAVDIAKYQVLSELSLLHLHCSRRQLELLHLLSLAVSTTNGAKAKTVHPLFPEYRPSVPPRDPKTAALWWNYARRCIGRLTRRRSWTELFLAFQKRQRFVQLYQRQAFCAQQEEGEEEEATTWLVPLTPQEEEELQEITLDPSISVHGIMIWRNLATAQYERHVMRLQKQKQQQQEAAQKKKGTFFFWRSRPKKDAPSEQEENVAAVERESLLQLSVEEFKELERVASDRMQQVGEMSQNDHSLLYQFQFALEALQATMTNHASKTVTTLDMGRVDLQWHSKANGAFAFSHSVSTFSVRDDITPASFFPLVVQTVATTTTAGSSALRVDLKKNAEGHGDLKLDMVEFRLVASPRLIQEIKQFFDLTALSLAAAATAPRQDDDNDDTLPKPTTTPLRAAAVEATTAAATVVSHQLSAAISDAWAHKKQTKAVWSIHCDIAAPVVLLPEDCTDANATVLVLDGGHFQLLHGKATQLPSPVELWFQQTKGPLETFYDASHIQVEELALGVATVAEQASFASLSSSSSSHAILQPMTFELDMAIEQTTSETDPSRTCVMGVLPTIAIRLSVSQVQQILKVAQTWMAVMSSSSSKHKGEEEMEEEEKDKEEEDEFMDAVEVIDDLDDTDVFEVPLSEAVAVDPGKTLTDAKETAVTPSYGHVDKFHLFLTLGGFSTQFLATDQEEGGSLEAHLVSITTSMTQSTDGSFQGRLCMGWFWLVDRLPSEAPRRQRLLMHSKLPRTADAYAAEGFHDILDHLQQEKTNAEPSELANVMIRQCHLDQLEDEKDRELGKAAGATKATVLKADFASLFVNANPLAIREMLQIPKALAQAAASSSSSSLESTNTTNLTTPCPAKKKPTRKKKDSTLSKSVAAMGRQSSFTGNLPTNVAPPITIVQLQMKGFQLAFRSALDDLPLCNFGVDGITVDFKLATDQSLVKTFHVDMETGEWSLVLSDWGTLPPDQSSLDDLQVDSFVLQSKVVAKVKCSTASAGNLEGCEVELHAQDAKVFTAQGFSEALTCPTQVMAPVSFSTIVSLASRTDQDEIQVKMVGLAGVAVSFSMQNMALLNSIGSSLGVTMELAAGSSRHEPPQKATTLTEEDVARIERLHSALVKEEQQDTASTHSLTSADSSLHSMAETVEPVATVQAKKSRKVTLSLTFPSLGCTLINDIFGQEVALLRVAVKKFVCLGNVFQSNNNNNNTFDMKLNTSVEADYFDAQTNLWESLLVQPWKLALDGQGGPKEQGRGSNKRSMTALQLDSHACHVSFTEQFLVSLGAALQMWNVYWAATTNTKTMEHVEGGRTNGGDDTAEPQPPTDNNNNKRMAMRKKLVATAARSLLDSLPYILENHSGLPVFFTLDEVSSSNGGRVQVLSGTARCFQFERHQRLFGQDVKEKKAVYLYVGNKTIAIPDVNAHVRTPPQAHIVQDEAIVVTHVWKRGKLTVVSVRSQVQVTNTSCLPIKVAVVPAGASASASGTHVGQCEAMVLETKKGESGTRAQETVKRTVGIPVEHLNGLSPNTRKNPSQPSVVLQISSQSRTARAVGRFDVPSLSTLMSQAAGASSYAQISELECVSEETPTGEALITFQMESTVSVVDGHPVVSLSLRPRAVVENQTPVAMLLRTPMPNTFSASMGDSVVEEWHVKASGGKSWSGQTVHRLEPLDSFEIYAPGESVDISFVCADQPSAGLSSTWIEKSFVAIPLGKQGLLPDPVRCQLPLTDKNGKSIGTGLGAEVFVAETSHVQQHLVRNDSGKEKNKKSAVTEKGPDSQRRIFLTVKHFVADHTGRLLVEQVRDALSKSSPPAIASSFSFHSPNRQLSLLPRSQAALRLVSTDGTRRSMPFLVEHVGLAEGGVGSTPVMWSDNKPSGFYAYRTLNAFDQDELHIIPEFVVFNGGSQDIAIKETTKPSMPVKAGGMVPIFGCDPKHGLVLAFQIGGDSGTGTGTSDPIRVDKLGTLVCIVRSSGDGRPLGSLTVQTVMGSRESRLVIKIGALRGAVNSRGVSGVVPGNALKLHIKWEELQLTLNDTERLGDSGAPIAAVVIDQKTFQAYEPVTTITIRQVDLDFERSFSGKSAKSEYSRMELIIDKISIVDRTPGTSSPVVLDLPADDCHLIHLCTRTTGPLSSDLIKVDLFDLEIGCKKSKAEKIVVDTGEDLVWRLLDIINRTSAAAAQLSGVDVDLQWDEATGQYNVSVLHLSGEQRPRFDFDTEEKYQPPGFEQLYHVKSLSVSPVWFRISFKRRPDLARYPAALTNSKVGNKVSYFLTRLKFNVDKADLSFAGYKTNNVKGSSGRLVEIVSAVYISQLKFKLITLLSAVSLHDWKFLTSRKEGGDEFLEGDVLRMTGNIVGRGSHFLVKGAGTVVGDGVSTLAGSLGDGIQNATELVGIGMVGKSVNSAVSGLGEGVGSTVKGVTSGAGQILKGTGKGVGQIAGGIGGGVLLAGKGIGKAVKKGDAKAIGTGLGEGISAVGTGVGHGVETTITGVGDGVLSAGKGLVSGVKSVGKGLVGKHKDPKKNNNA